MKIRTGDTVIVLKGKDKGKQGEVIHVHPDVEKVTVDGVNIAKKHQKPTRSMQQGGIIDKPMPIHISNVSLLADGKPTRVGYRIDAQGQKIRVSKQTGGDL
jgi:large subunit ribosomal protein L24